MTWLGKILSVFVFIMGVAALWFITTVFVARTNWKNDRDAWKKLYEEARTARETEINSYRTDKDALERQLAAEQNRSKGLNDTIVSLKGANDKVVDDNKKMAKIIKDADVGAADLQANLQAQTDEVKKTRDRNLELEKERVALVTAKENAEKERQAFENLAKQATNDKLLAEGKVESLNTLVAELSASGGNPNSVVPRSFSKAAAPLPDNIRGTITTFKGDLALISIGIDAGLTNGAVLDVWRSEGGGQYLGTLTVERVWPKQAVAQFKSANGRALSKLRPEELPKVGDSVGKVGRSGPLTLK
jgi:hypothetical protein